VANNKWIKALANKFKPLCDVLDVVMINFKYDTRCPHTLDITSAQQEIGTVA